MAKQRHGSTYEKWLKGINADPKSQDEMFCSLVVPRLGGNIPRHSEVFYADMSGNNEYAGSKKWASHSAALKRELAADKRPDSYRGLIFVYPLEGRGFECENPAHFDPRLPEVLGSTFGGFGFYGDHDYVLLRGNVNLEPDPPDMDGKSYSTGALRLNPRDLPRHTHIVDGDRVEDRATEALLAESNFSIKPASDYVSVYDFGKAVEEILLCAESGYRNPHHWVSEQLQVKGLLPTRIALGGVRTRYYSK
ncbi:MAG: hypothetical protein HY365_03670 [Candidatus Aenigmarchaeota archaeon]|nr:hypothetical protein [Candidatus Aenigmarchaeota archaeon]